MCKIATTVFVISLLSRVLHAQETTITLSQEAVTAGIQYYDSRLRSCPLYFKLRMEEKKALSERGGAVQRYSPYHEYGYDGTTQYYHGASWSRVPTTGQVCVTTDTILYDGEKSIEKSTQSTAGNLAGDEVTLHGGNRIELRKGIQLAGILPGAASIEKGLISHQIADGINKGARLLVSGDRIGGKTYVKISILSEFSPGENFRKDFWVDAGMGFRPVRITHSGNGGLRFVQTFTAWNEVIKEIFVPFRSRVEWYLGGPADRNPTIVRQYYIEEVKAGKDFPSRIFTLALAEGTPVWDYRFNMGYNVGADGRILEAEDLLNLKKSQSAAPVHND